MWNQQDRMDTIDPRAIAHAKALLEMIGEGSGSMGTRPGPTRGLLGSRPDLNRGGSGSAPGAEYFGGQTWSTARGGDGGRSASGRSTVWSEPRDYEAREYEMRDGYDARAAPMLRQPSAMHGPAANLGPPRNVFNAGGGGGMGSGSWGAGGGDPFRARSVETGITKWTTVAELMSNFRGSDFDMVPSKWYLYCRECHIR